MTSPITANILQSGSLSSTDQTVQQPQQLTNAIAVPLNITSTLNQPLCKCVIATASAIPKKTIDDQNYDDETVRILFSMMKKAGYGDRKQQNKSLKDVFAEAIALAEKNNGIKKNAKVWQKKFTRIKQEYSAYIAKVH